MPLLGEYCIKTLGFSMKGYLHRFVGARTHLFELGDDGRQHIFIKAGVMDAVASYNNKKNWNNDNGNDDNNINIKIILIIFAMRRNSRPTTCTHR